MSTAADHVPAPEDEAAQLLVREEFLCAQLAVIHAQRAVHPRYTPDSDRTPAPELLCITDPDPEC